MKEHVKSFHPDSSLERIPHADLSSSWLRLPEVFLPIPNLSSLPHQGIWALSSGSLGRTYIFSLHSHMLLVLGTNDNTAENCTWIEKKFSGAVMKQISANPSFIFTYVSFAPVLETKALISFLAVKKWQLYPSCRRIVMKSSHHSSLSLDTVPIPKEIMHLRSSFKLKQWTEPSTVFLFTEDQLPFKAAECWEL